MLQAVAFKPSAADARLELRELVSAGDLSRAVRRLLDFARDFTPGRELENEAVGLAARLNLLRRDIRAAGPSPATEAKQNSLVASILELADEINAQCEAPGRAEPTVEPLKIALHAVPDPRSRSTAAGGPIAPPAPMPLLVTPPPPDTTRLDEARLRFRHLRQAAPTAARDVAFRCEGLQKAYKRRGTFELSGLSFELRPGEVTGLVGVNGAGKTTILRMIAGELRPSQGTASYPLLDPKRTASWATIRRQIAYVEQSPRQWYGGLAENLQLAAAVHGLHGRDNEDEVEFVLQRLGLAEYREHTWSEISGGFKMRFELARALVSQPKLLVLDEPLAPLDVLTQQLFLQDLRDLANSARKPLPIIVSSQHLYEIESIADQLLFLDGGKAAYCGRLADLASEREDNLFELSVRLTRVQLEERLRGVVFLDIQEFGPTFQVRVPRAMSSGDFMRAIVGAGVELIYFRDISQSTRRLFESRMDQL